MRINSKTFIYSVIFFLLSFFSIWKEPLCACCKQNAKRNRKAVQWLFAIHSQAVLPTIKSIEERRNEDRHSKYDISSMRSGIHWSTPTVTELHLCFCMMPRLLFTCSFITFVYTCAFSRFFFPQLCYILFYILFFLSFCCSGLPNFELFHVIPLAFVFQLLLALFHYEKGSEITKFSSFFFNYTQHASKSTNSHLF